MQMRQQVTDEADDVCRVQKAICTRSPKEACKRVRDRDHPTAEDDTISSTVQGLHRPDEIRFGATCALKEELYK